MLEKMTPQQAAEYTRAALAESVRSTGFVRVIGQRLDAIEQSRLVGAMLTAMATIKRGPHRNETVRIDAGEMGYLPRELLYKLKSIKEVKYAEMKGRQLVPISNEVPAGAETHSYEVFDRTGRAKVGSNYEGRAPRADVKVAEVMGKIDVVRMAYGWTVQDLRAAAFSGRSLPVARGMACRAAMEFGIDENLANGVVNTALKGLTNNAEIPIYSSDTTGGATTLTGFTGAWSNGTTTGLQMIADCNLLIATVRVATKEVEMNGKNVDLVLPTAAYNAIATTPYSTLQPEPTLSVLLRTSPWIRSVSSWYRLTGIGVSSRNRALFYTRDAGNLEGQIPLEIMQHPPEQVALEFLVEMEARIAGVDVYYPASAAYLDGV